MSNTYTVIIMAAFFVAFIGIDVWLALDKKDGNTYSENMRKWGKAWPPLRLLFAFGFGLLCGHWWWGTVEYVDSGTKSIPVDAAPADAVDAGSNVVVDANP